MAGEQKPGRGLLRRFAPLLAVVMVVAACGGGADSDALAESEAARQAAEERVAELEAQLAGQGATGALPDIAALVEANGLSRFVEEMDVDFASLHMSDVAFNGVAEEDVENLFAALGFPSSMMSRIGNTRALDGTQSAVGDDATVYWIFQGADGLDIVIERDQP